MRELLLALYDKYGESLLMMVEQEFTMENVLKYHFKFKEEFCMFTVKIKYTSTERNSLVYPYEPLLVNVMSFDILPYITELQSTIPYDELDLLGSYRISRCAVYNKEYDINKYPEGWYYDGFIALYAEVVSKWGKKKYSEESHYERLIERIDEIREISRIRMQNVVVSSDIWFQINIKNRYISIRDALFPQKEGVM